MVKRPKGRTVSQPAKAPKADSQSSAASTESERPVFSFALIDKSTPPEFGWALLNDASRKEVLDFIENISGSTWREIRQQTVNGHLKYHSMDFGALTKAAQERITALRSSERFDTVFRFRLSSRARLWGLEEGRVFHILWWDPNHLVYPTEK